jgi:hypothetical protein
MGMLAGFQLPGAAAGASDAAKDDGDQEHGETIRTAHINLLLGSAFCRSFE